ncbi:MAG: spore coat protein [Clostridiales bacterium]|nr:spore coat protein [Clostridiales bacterium]
MRLQKSQSTLCEKDAIMDMMDSEKQLISLYATALFEGSTKSMRKAFSENLLAVSSDQYDLFTQMSARGYYKPAPAQKNLIDEANNTFKKEKNALKAE